MDAVLFEMAADQLLAAVELADEMAEDPRCRFVAVGQDQAAMVIYSLWDGEVGEEVAAGLGSRQDVAKLRRLSVPPGMAIWG